MESKKLKKNKLGQVFSTDIVVVIIIVLFGAIFLVLNQINQTKDISPEERFDNAQTQSEILIGSLEKDEIIKADNSIDVNKLLTLNDKDLKEELNIKNDFCIVFEKDGKLVKIDPNSKTYGIGSENIIVNGEPCK